MSFAQGMEARESAAAGSTWGGEVSLDAGSSGSTLFLGYDTASVLSLGDGDMQEWGSQSVPEFEGDFYRLPDSTLRGCTLGAASVHMGEQFDGDGWYDTSCDIHWAADSQSWAKASSESTALPPPQFPKAKTPNEVPGGQASITSVLLRAGISAGEAADCLYTYLTTRVKASIIKVRHEKFSITAAYFDESDGFLLKCTLKARVYLATDGKGLIIDFSRRSGDGVAFSRIFRQASDFVRTELAARCMCPAEQQQMQATATNSDPVLRRKRIAEVDAMAPPPELKSLKLWLDDATSQDMPPMAKAEAATALAAVASANVAGTAAVCAAFAAKPGLLEDLVSSRCLDVAYPAARLASALARDSRGEVVEACLPAAVKLVACEKTDRLVRQELVSFIEHTRWPCCKGVTAVA
eukprot:gnl/TRDRNA2_/TRDRNA2_61002_c0_seq1.p1 gnl/TRDRNA2_/TRDRNA2_61002_c0~~gnl/TRDRNA2_/TRDRNA2_61002_c0_seq1.p1  ORF type:complete len:409 (-),score=65.51 gnl/TRDRNA2_/TRDRNA2_61002_c0_seq1:42-1268(-)